MVEVSRKDVQEEIIALDNGHTPFILSKALPSHIEGAKRLVDSNRDTFGFVTRGAFNDALKEDALIVALCEDKVVGFLRYHHRKRDLQTTLYDICVTESLRGHGLGTKILEMFIKTCVSMGRESILLKCPINSKANTFYEKNRFCRIATVEGKRRNLNVWQMKLDSRGLE